MKRLQISWLYVSSCCNAQGELEITTEAGSGKAAQPGPDGQLADHVDRVPFLMLALDLPPAPLYKDALEKDIIPQVLHLAFMLADQVFCPPDHAVHARWRSFPPVWDTCHMPCHIGAGCA